MPTATQFRGAATDLATFGFPMKSLERTPSNMQYDFGFSGGDVAEAVSLGLGAGASNADTVGPQVLAVIDELERRAKVCDQYSAEMETYRTRLYVYNTYGPGSEPPPTLLNGGYLDPPPPPPPVEPRRTGGGDSAFFFSVWTFPTWVEEG